MSIRYPAPLGPGDRIAATSPSCGVGREMRPRLEFCIRHLRDLGYEVVVGGCSRSYPSGSRHIAHSEGPPTMASSPVTTKP